VETWGICAVEWEALGDNARCCDEGLDVENILCVGVTRAVGQWEEVYDIVRKTSMTKTRAERYDCWVK